MLLSQECAVAILLALGEDEVCLVAELSQQSIVSSTPGFLGQLGAGLGHHLHPHGTNQWCCFNKCEKEMFNIFMNEFKQLFFLI